MTTTPRHLDQADFDRRMSEIHEHLAVLAAEHRRLKRSHCILAQGVQEMLGLRPHDGAWARAVELVTGGDVDAS